MRYRTATCPNCSHALRRLSVRAAETVGPPLVRCPACGAVLSTGAKHWSDMNRGEKWDAGMRLAFFLQHVVLTHVILLCVLPVMLLSSFFDLQADHYLIAIALVALVVGGLYARNTLRQLRLRPQPGQTPEWR